MFDKAVLIGIQNYTKSNFGSLDGPEQDIFNIEKIIKKNKKNAKIVKILDTNTSYVQPTKENIMKELDSIYKDVHENSRVLIYYSGHGSNIKTKNKDEYDKNYDQVMNVMNNKIITDNEINKCIKNNIPKGVSVYLIFDCCHSGDIVDLKYKLIDNEFKPIRPSDPEMDNLIVLISGCAFTQSTTDAPKGGAFTNRLLEILEDNKFDISFKDLHVSLNKKLEYLKIWFGMSQEPQIFCSKKLDGNNNWL
jgi:hypothetical protein